MQRLCPRSDAELWGRRRLVWAWTPSLPGQRTSSLHQNRRGLWEARNGWKPQSGVTAPLQPPGSGCDLHAGGRLGGRGRPRVAPPGRAQTCILPGQGPEGGRVGTGDRAGTSLTVLRTAWQAPPPRAPGDVAGDPAQVAWPRALGRTLRSPISRRGPTNPKFRTRIPLGHVRRRRAVTTVAAA